MAAGYRALALLDMSPFGSSVVAIVVVRHSTANFYLLSFHTLKSFLLCEDASSTFIMPGAPSGGVQGR
jgi:hypothetical protein